MAEQPERIGPYRVLERLGAGGMGEVFLAWDDRLDRRVALKRIRPGADASPERRERFRREARIAACLNHPAIVQVYDVLAEEEGDWIVLEYVEGTTLRSRLARGGLPAREAVALAQDVARGLDAAHRQGIVHRDLKTENVLVTPGGQAKIADFGVAKRLGGEPRETEAATADGVVLGTYRAMSPEQARGEEVDARSDLFSFGVLLYEALTGRSPFEAGNGLATVQRILGEEPPPVRELNPEVPAGLSDLVGHLLQKDPRLRPRSAGEVARALESFSSAAGTGEETMTVSFPAPPPTAAPSIPSAAPPRPDSALTGVGPLLRRPALAVVAALAVAALVAVAFLLRRPEPRLSVAVLPPRIETGGSADSALLSAAVEDALVRGLVSLEGVSPKGSDELRGVAGSPVQMARAVAADELVRSRLDCRTAGCRVSLQRVSGKDGGILWSESFDVPADELDRVSRAVTSQLRRGYAGRRLRPGAAEIAVSGPDLAEFLRLRERFESRRGGSLEEILAGLEALRRRAPRFPDACLLEAHALRYRFDRSRDPADLQRALDLIQEARRMDPSDPQPLLDRAQIAAESGRPDLAEASLKELEDLIPGDPRLLERRALILNAQGQPREAIQLLRQAADLQPSWKRLYRLAFLEYQQGEIAPARRHLEQSLGRSPGNNLALSLLAQVELSYGDPERAARLYADLVRRAPGPAEISNLGLAEFLLGRYEEAAGAFRRVAGQDPKNPLFALNLADAQTLAGHPDEARQLYGRVVDLIAADPSATGPQFLTAKAQALAHLGRGPEAAAAVQEALRLAPSNAQVAYEAALVYSLLGERSSAVANAGRALSLGYEPRWFSFPWFDAIRADPGLKSRLARSPLP